VGQRVSLGFLEVGREEVRPVGEYITKLVIYVKKKMTGIFCVNQALSRGTAANGFANKSALCQLMPIAHLSFSVKAALVAQNSLPPSRMDSYAGDQ
jgi:hypothetical protein